MIRHLQVDFARELDETSLKVKLLCLPREIEGIDRNAVAAKSRTWIKRLEAKWLRCSSPYYFKDVDSHAQAQQLEFVH